MKVTCRMNPLVPGDKLIKRSLYNFCLLSPIQILPLWLKHYYRIPQFPQEEDWFTLRPSLQYYFRPWVHLSVEPEGPESGVEIPSSFLNTEELDYFQSFDC